MVRRTRGVLAGGCETLRSPSGVHCGAGGGPRMPSNRGSTSRGFSSRIRTSPCKRRKCWIYNAREWDGKPLGRNDYVISADEKTSIQARCRCHPTLPPGKARTMRVNHDYHRRGAIAYLAAYDVHRAQIHGRCEDTTGIVPFTALVQQVMTQEPYKSAERVFWVVDNGSSHRGQAAINRLAEQFPNAIMVYTPVHASWLNQVEIFFSIIQRKVVSPNDFHDLDVVVERLAAFETRYNQAAKPFKWKFTTTALNHFLNRLDTHRPAINTDPAQPRAA